MHRLILLCLALAPGVQPVLAQTGGASTADAPADAFDSAFDDFDEAFAEDSGAIRWSGFVEGAYGRKLDADPRFATRQSLGDIRIRAETEWAGERLAVSFKGEALYDDYASDVEVDARELSLQLSPTDDLDLKIGRQVLTWGTGDLLFLNDLFPKSWVSFFAGRDDEYLKAPSDAVRATWYTGLANFDVVLSPRFEPDDYLTGERFAFFSPLAGEVVAPRPPLTAVEPTGELAHGELALRVFRTIESTEYALYLYRGYFKRPLGLTTDLIPSFPRLNVVGGSLRRPLGPGLFNAEVAWQDSRADPDGTNPLVPNGQARLLLAYEFEARTRLTLAFQYYTEITQDHAQLLANSPAPDFEPDRSRQVVTNRLTYRGRRDRLSLSLFTFYSPSDDDHYLRPAMSFRQSDQWLISAGLNLFNGESRHTFFGQLEDNSNAYFRVRFNY